MYPVASPLLCLSLGNSPSEREVLKTDQWVYCTWFSLVGRGSRCEVGLGSCRVASCRRGAFGKTRYHPFWERSMAVRPCTSSPLISVRRWPTVQVIISYPGLKASLHCLHTILGYYGFNPEYFCGPRNPSLFPTSFSSNYYPLLHHPLIHSLPTHYYYHLE